MRVLLGSQGGEAKEIVGDKDCNGRGTGGAGQSNLDSVLCMQSEMERMRIELNSS